VPDRAPFVTPRDVVVETTTLGDDPGVAPVTLRAHDEDFRVDEVASFSPSGSGEHLFLRVEKSGHSTMDLVAALSRAYGISTRDIGFAGRKDARGVTSQWLSAPRRAIDDDGARLKEHGRYVVLEAAPHQKKLHLGVLAGNRFTLTLRTVDDDSASAPPLDAERVLGRARHIAASGFANFFGAQRFGQDLSTLDEADRFLTRAFVPRSRKDLFLVSAAQAAFFNVWLRERVQDNLLFDAVHGDVLGLFGRGSTFVCEDPLVDGPRVRALEVDPRGPLFGAEMRPASHEAMTRESRSLRGRGIDPEVFKSHPAFRTGDRRPAIATAKDLEGSGDARSVRLSFVLAKGAYATVFLREVFGRALHDAAFPSSES